MLSILILAILSVCAGAIADGLNERNKDAGHLIEPLEKPLLLITGILGGWVVIASYICLRVALFDPIKNIAAGQKLLYIGTVGWWDKFLAKQQTVGIIFGRVIFLAAGIFITLHYVK